MFSKTAVRKYQDEYYRKYGEDLSDEEAEYGLSELSKLLKSIAKRKEAKK